MSYRIKKDFLHVKDDNGNWITVDALADPTAGQDLAQALNDALDVIIAKPYILSDRDNTLTGQLTLSSKDLQLSVGNVYFSNPHSNSSENGIRWLISQSATTVEGYYKQYYELDTDSHQVLKLKHHQYDFDSSGNLKTGDSYNLEKTLLSTNGSKITLCNSMEVDYASKNITMTSGGITLETGALILNTNNINLKKGNLLFTDTTSASSQNGIRWLVSSVPSGGTPHNIYWEIDTNTNQVLKLKYHTYNLAQDGSMSSDALTEFISVQPQKMTLNYADIVSPTLSNITLGLDSEEWELVTSDIACSHSTTPPTITIDGITAYQLNLEAEKFKILNIWMPTRQPELFVSGDPVGNLHKCGIVFKNIDGTPEAIGLVPEVTIHVTYLKQKGSADLTWAVANA